MDLRQSVWRQLLSIAVIAIVSRAGARRRLMPDFCRVCAERRLFELAEAYCADRIRRAAPREASQAELTVELVRTLSLHAVNLPPAARDASVGKGVVGRGRFSAAIAAPSAGDSCGCKRR